MYCHSLKLLLLFVVHCHKATSLVGTRVGKWAGSEIRIITCRTGTPTSRAWRVVRRAWQSRSRMLTRPIVACCLHIHVRRVLYVAESVLAHPTSRTSRAEGCSVYFISWSSQRERVLGSTRLPQAGGWPTVTSYGMAICCTGISILADSDQVSSFGLTRSSDARGEPVFVWLRIFLHR